MTPESLQLANEVLPGNTASSTTLRGFLDRIAHRYGKARRVWVMNRGVPTEESLQHMRAGDPPVHYLVGTPKGRLSKLEKDHRKAGLKSVQPVAVGAIEVQGVDAIKARARCPSLSGMRQRYCPWYRLHLD